MHEKRSIYLFEKFPITLLFLSPRRFGRISFWLLLSRPLSFSLFGFLRKSALADNGRRGSFCSSCNGPACHWRFFDPASIRSRLSSCAYPRRELCNYVRWRIVLGNRRKGFSKTGQLNMKFCKKKYDLINLLRVQHRISARTDY